MVCENVGHLLWICRHTIVWVGSISGVRLSPRPATTTIDDKSVSQPAVAIHISVDLKHKSTRLRQIWACAYLLHARMALPSAC